MRILLVGQFFDPEPSFKGMNFARALVARGHQVEVLTGFPNYPGGIVYPGYRIRPFQREWMDGIPINRVALYPSHSRSSLGRALNYLSFAASGTLGALLAVSRADVAYVYHPPATAVIPAMAMRAIRRIPYVLDVQDLWPDTLAATGMVPAGLPLRMVDTLVRATYRNAAHVVVQSHGFRERLLARGIPAEKVTVVYNWCDAPSLRGSDAEVGELVATAPREHFTILFAGTMGLAQGLDTVLDAAALCTTRLPNARFIFVGGGSDRERLERSSKKRGLQNVEFHPPRPPRAMPELFTQADVLLVHLKDEPLFRITIPSKTQAYLAIGKPVLMAVRGEAAELVERAGAGITCTPGDPEAIVRALIALRDAGPAGRSRMGLAGRRFYDEKLSLDAGVEQFDLIFRAVRATPHSLPDSRA